MKAFIMLVRGIGVAAIVLGLLLWNSGDQKFLAMHIAVGFLVVTLVFVLAAMAITKKAVLLAVAALVLVVVLPIVGFLQLPLLSRTMGGLQILHLAVALSVLGLAERLYAATKRAG